VGARNRFVGFDVLGDVLGGVCVLRIPEVSGLGQ
jgi:hypothetical protein